MRRGPVEPHVFWWIKGVDEAAFFFGEIMGSMEPHGFSGVKGSMKQSALRWDSGVDEALGWSSREGRERGGQSRGGG